MFKKMLLSVVLLAVVVTGANAQAYRWTDSAGKSHISDAPPPRGAKNAQYHDFQEQNLSERLKKQRKERRHRASKNFQLPSVMFYSSPTCGANCDTVRQLLTERGVTFNEKIISDELDEEWIVRQVGANVVPSVTVGQNVQKGFNPKELQSVLDKAGFPKTVPMPEMKDPAKLDKLQDDIRDVE